MAPVVKALAEHTDFDLNLMKPTQDLFDITINVLLSMRDVYWRFDRRGNRKEMK